LQISGIYRAAFLSWIILILILAHFTTLAHAAEVSLSWDPNAEPDLAGYKIYYGVQTGNYDQSVDVGNQTTYTLAGLEENQTIYLAATAYDANGNESDYSKEVTFKAINQPPTADAGPDQIVKEGASVSLSGANSTDPEGRALSYVWVQTSGPISVDISNPTSAQPSFTAPDVDVDTDGGTLIFRLTVTDDIGLQAEDYCIVNVSWQNSPPTANAGTDQTVAEGDEVALYGGDSSDLDDGIAAVYWQQIGGPQVTILDPTQTATSFTAPELTSGSVSLVFELAVQDMGGLIATDTCVVNVTWLNTPPTADAGRDQTVSEGDTVILDGSASKDPDDGIASIRWTQTGGAPVALSSPTALNPKFTAPAATKSETLTFQITVTDKAGLASQDSCSVTVNPNAQGVNPTPSITANNSDGSVRVFRRQPVSVSISVDSVDLGGAPVDLWLIVDAPEGRLFYVKGIGWQSGSAPYSQSSLDKGISCKVFNDKLPVGNYTFYFAIDNNGNGTFDGTWMDTVSVEVW